MDDGHVILTVERLPHLCLVAGCGDAVVRVVHVPNTIMVFGDKTFADAPRSQLFRTMFLNHQIHHRAQLGVYLRLNNLPVPALYGPSADDRMGF